jgi:hypothetical protein
MAIVGSMCFMSGSVEMENAYLPENEVGIWQWLFGKTINNIVVRNSGQSDGFVGIAAPYFARILPVCTCLNCLNNRLLLLFFQIKCQNSSFVTIYLYLSD